MAKIIHAVGYESREIMKNVLCLQVLPRLRIVLPDSSDFWTSVLFGAIAASLEALFPGTFPNLAQRAAEYGLGPVHTAALAVDVFRKNGCIVQFRP